MSNAVMGIRSRRDPARWCAWIGLGVIAVSALACRPATGGDSEFWAPAPSVESAGSTGAPVGSGSEATSGAGAAPPPTAGPELTVGFTTVSFNGEYAPDNVGAVWVTDDQDVFVKTLEVWAVKRIKYLVKWKAASGESVVDAVTSATRSQHGPHELTWDMTDVGGNIVPDGVYRVYLEFTEQNGAGPSLARDFVKGADPVALTPPDVPTFTGQHLTYTP
jgi:hypothetical protein